MTKKILPGILVAFLALMGFASPSVAASVLPSEYSIINPTEFVYTDQAELPLTQGPGYYIWAASNDLTSLRTRWTGDAGILFNGNINLYGTDGSYEKVSFETGDYSATSTTNAVFFTWARSNGDYEGFNIELNALNNLAYISFDLFYNGKAVDGDMVFLGKSYETASSLGADQDFAIPLAPTPLPATVLLFGSGLVGLLGITRRKK